jgi:beta-phosphoglucomutase-like phosphatase (HAD superfamily)
MNVEANRCAVIEDSASGVEAGVAAGMTVFAFCGGVTNADQLERDGVVLFDSMSQLPTLLESA